MKIIFGLALSSLALAGCGKKEEYKYELVENQCSTGEKQADSKEKMCSQLKDDAANNGCAYRLRKEKFEQNSCGSWNG
jgi:hypothetical protein